MDPFSAGREMRPRAAKKAEFARFHDEHYPGLVALLHALYGSRSHAHRAAQRAFTQAWMRWDNLRASTDPVGWVRREARKIPAPRRRAVPATDAHDPEWVAPVARPAFDALGALPERHRTVLALRHIGGLSHSRIARDERLPVEAVAALIVEARQLLAQRMSGIEPDGPVPPAPWRIHGRVSYELANLTHALSYRTDRRATEQVFRQAIRRRATVAAATAAVVSLGGVGGALMVPQPGPYPGTLRAPAPEPGALPPAEHPDGTPFPFEDDGEGTSGGYGGYGGYGNYGDQGGYFAQRGEDNDQHRRVLPTSWSSSEDAWARHFSSDPSSTGKDKGRGPAQPQAKPRAVRAAAPAPAPERRATASPPRQAAPAGQANHRAQRSVAPKQQAKPNPPAQPGAGQRKADAPGRKAERDHNPGHRNAAAREKPGNAAASARGQRGQREGAKRGNGRHDGRGHDKLRGKGHLNGKANGKGGKGGRGSTEKFRSSDGRGGDHSSRARGGGKRYSNAKGNGRGDGRSFSHARGSGGGKSSHAKGNGGRGGGKSSSHARGGGGKKSSHAKGGGRGKSHGGGGGGRSHGGGGGRGR